MDFPAAFLCPDVGFIEMIFFFQFFSVGIQIRIKRNQSAVGAIHGPSLLRFDEEDGIHAHDAARDELLQILIPRFQIDIDIPIFLFHFIGTQQGETGVRGHFGFRFMRPVKIHVLPFAQIIGIIRQFAVSQRGLVDLDRRCFAPGNIDIGKISDGGVGDFIVGNLLSEINQKIPLFYRILLIKIKMKVLPDSTVGFQQPGYGIHVVHEILHIDGYFVQIIFYFFIHIIVVDSVKLPQNQRFHHKKRNQHSKNPDLDYTSGERF